MPVCNMGCINVSSHNYNILIYVKHTRKVPVKFVCMKLQDRLIKKEITQYFVWVQSIVVMTSKNGFLWNEAIRATV